MNLFDILSAGKRDLNEENVSSFLAWILDPKQSHGCGPLFLNRLLGIVDKDKYQQLLSKMQNITVDVLLEDRVETNRGSERSVDIVVIMSCTKESGQSNDCNVVRESQNIIFAIENKIRECADKFQLRDESEGLINNYKDGDISLLYLTPSKSDKFKECFSLLPYEFNKYWLNWAGVSNESNDSTIVAMFRNILQDDLNAKINPLSNELKFVLKSFIVFAEKAFRADVKKAQISVKRRNKYFKDSVLGIDGVRELQEQNKSEINSKIYIGFLGGINALKKNNIEKLEDRVYKWDDNLDNKKITNWIPIEQFIEIIDKSIESSVY